MADDSLDVILDLSRILGTEEAPSAQQLVLYIPNKGKDGKQIKHLNRWLKEDREILTKIGGGATAFPPADGTWLNPEINRIICEKTKIIYTYIYSDKFDRLCENTSFLNTLLVV